MIPIKDNIVASTFPIVNYAIIGFTSVVFAFQLLENDKGNELVERFSMIPARVQNPDQPVLVPELVPHQGPFGVELVPVMHRAAETPFSPWLTLLTCIFLHGGWMHFLGNMWFLFIFGDNVEDRFGHFGYLLFYLASGVLASLTHVLTNLSSTMPTLGASGAIAGVMGGLETKSFMFSADQRRRLQFRADLFNLFNHTNFSNPVSNQSSASFGKITATVGSAGAFTVTSTQTGGVAWWAHIGGFAAGFLIALVLQTLAWLRPKATTLRPNTDRVTYYRYRSLGGD